LRTHRGGAGAAAGRARRPAGEIEVPQQRRPVGARSSRTGRAPASSLQTAQQAVSPPSHAAPPRGPRLQEAVAGEVEVLQRGARLQALHAEQVVAGQVGGHEPRKAGQPRQLQQPRAPQLQRPRGAAPRAAVAAAAGAGRTRLLPPARRRTAVVKRALRLQLRLLPPLGHRGTQLALRRPGRRCAARDVPPAQALQPREVPQQEGRRRRLDRCGVALQVEVLQLGEAAAGGVGSKVEEWF
jgi:hypothetical protein